MARRKMMSEQKEMERITRGILFIFIFACIIGVAMSYIIPEILSGLNVLVESLIITSVVVLFVTVSIFELFRVD